MKKQANIEEKKENTGKKKKEHNRKKTSSTKINQQITDYFPKQFISENKRPSGSISRISEKDLDPEIKKKKTTSSPNADEIEENELKKKFDSSKQTHDQETTIYRETRSKSKHKSENLKAENESPQVQMLFEEKSPPQTKNQKNLPLESFLQKLEESIKNLPDKLNFKFGENNKLFAGRFYHYNANSNEEIIEITAFPTVNRKEILVKIVNNLQNDIDSNKEETYVIDGPQGTGKTYTMLILSHVFRSFENVKLVFLQNTKKINKHSWSEVCKQFTFAFPEKSEIIEIQKLKPDQFIISYLRNLINEFNSKNYITILMIDQLNFLNDKGKDIVMELEIMSWTFQFYSQSSNNDKNENKKLKDLKSFFSRELMSEDEIRELINEHIALRKKDKKILNDFNYSEDNFQRLKQYAGLIPREVVRVFDCRGNNFDEKLDNYITIRYQELSKNHKKFRNSIMDRDQKDELNQTIFYTDKNMIVNFQDEPLIDKQIQILEMANPDIPREEQNDYLIFSSFPLCNMMLQTFISKSKFVDHNFFNDRLGELKQLLHQVNLNPSVRGNLYEEYILTTFQNYQRKNQNFILQLVFHQDLNKSDTEKNKLMIKLPISIDTCKFFKKDEEIFSSFETFSVANKTFFMRPVLSNNKAIDAGYFSANSRREINPLPACLAQSNDLVVYFQVKKDFKLCCKEQSQIKAKWIGKREQLKEKYANSSKLDFIFVIVTEYQGCKKSWKPKKGEDDIFFMFTDTDSENKKIFNLK